MAYPQRSGGNYSSREGAAYTPGDVGDSSMLVRKVAQTKPLDGRFQSASGIADLPSVYLDPDE